MAAPIGDLRPPLGPFRIQLGELEGGSVYVPVGLPYNMAFESVIRRNKTGFYPFNASNQHLLLDTDSIVRFCFGCMSEGGRKRFDQSRQETVAYAKSVLALPYLPYRPGAKRL